MIINVLVDTPYTFTDTTHTATIKYAGILNEKCSDASPAAFKINGGTISKLVTVEGLTFIKMSKARGQFQLHFSLQRDLRKGNAFYFDWGFLSSGFVDAADFYCKVRIEEDRCCCASFYSICS